MVFAGLLDLSLGAYILIGLFLIHLSTVSTSIYLHRHLAHRSLKLHPLATTFFRLCIYLLTGTRVKGWVAVHRKHHEYPDTLLDPHSPQIVGLRTLLVKGYFLYRKESLNPDTLRKYGKGVPRDSLENALDFLDRWPGVFVLLGVEVLLFGLVPGIILWILPMFLLNFFSNGIVNGVGHYWGYRNYEIPEAAKNISPIGLLMAGEELHNNHHADISVAKFSRKWWEVDVSWFYIRILEFLHLAQARRPS